MKSPTCPHCKNNKNTQQLKHLLTLAEMGANTDKCKYGWRCYCFDCLKEFILIRK